MKKITIILCTFLFTMMGVSAQPGTVQKVAKSVFTLTTFKKDGSILASSHGVFIGNNGDAISTWTPFVGAESAVVVDASGNKMDVDALEGANEIYDICKFHVNRTTPGAVIASTPSAQGSKVWLVDYSLQKPQMKQLTVSSIEKFMDKYTYYMYSGEVAENAYSCPVANQNGQIIGLLQKAKTSTDLYSTDANFTETFKLNGLSINEPLYKQTGIRLAMPNSIKDAQLMMIMSQQSGDSIQHAKYIDDFLRLFPTAVDGYSAHAQNAIAGNDFATADKDMTTAINKVANKDEAHSEYAKIIYEKEIYKSNVPYTSWTFDKALDEAKQAYSIKPEPAYKHQQAQIIYAKGDYKTAYDMFMDLTKTPIRNGELFYECAQCKTQLKAPDTEITALLDSAVNACPKPFSPIAAPYFLARGEQYNKLGDYRKAIADYNKYDTLSVTTPSSAFYYTRYKAEVAIRQYQPALLDIARAIIITPSEPTYYAEMASLQLRVNQLDNAIKTASKCIELAPEYADAYIILGLAQIQKKDKVEGLKQLEKAKELGDSRAQGLIDKYK